MSIIEDLVNLIAPHECLGCQMEGSLLCPACSGRLRRIPSRCYLCRRLSDDFSTCGTCRKRTPLRAVLAVVPYDDKLTKELLHRLKFERARAAATTIARTMAERCEPPTDTVITYVPTATARVRERGYDQAELIAKALAKELDRPFIPLLARIGAGRQLGQRRDVRREQMRDAFRTLKASTMTGNRVLLVDDVLTTGATCEAAARTLRKAGVRHVSAAVFAVA